MLLEIILDFHSVKDFIKKAVAFLSIQCYFMTLFFAAVYCGRLLTIAILSNLSHHLG